MPGHEIIRSLHPTLPERTPAVRKEESGIRERRSVPSDEVLDAVIDGEEPSVYAARREAFRAFHELQSSVIKLVDLGLKHLPLDSDARDILLEVRQYPSETTPLYETHNGRRPATIFTDLPDPRGKRLWDHLARLTYDVKTLRIKAQAADKAVHSYEEQQQARHTLLASYFDPA